MQVANAASSSASHAGQKQISKVSEKKNEWLTYSGTAKLKVWVETVGDGWLVKKGTEKLVCPPKREVRKISE